MDKLYSVSELAKELGATPRAIRLYEDKGLIRPRRAGNTRVYGRGDRARLILILRGKRLGFSLREIGEWLDLYDGDPGHVKQMRELLRAVLHRIAGLEGRRADLEETLRELRTIEASVREHLKAAGEEPAAADRRDAVERVPNDIRGG